MIFWSSFSWLFDQVFSWSKECRQTSAAGSHPWMWDLFPLPQMISKERNFWVREKSQSSRWFCRVCNIYLLSFYRSHNFGLFNAHLMSYLRCLFCASVLRMLQSNMFNWDVVEFFFQIFMYIMNKIAIIRCDFSTLLEPVSCKKQQKNSWPVTGLQNKEPLKNLNDFKLIVYESKWIPLIIQDHLYTIFSYNKPALVR